MQYHSQEDSKKLELIQTVTPLIGHDIALCDVHTDEAGWYYYIPVKGLKRWHPLILFGHRNALHMFIPTADFSEMLSGHISVAKYVEQSQWNFGHCTSGGSLLYGIYWRPFEEHGIHDTQRIAQYFSALAEKKAKMSWSYDEHEEDDRKKLFRLIKSRLKKNFGFSAKVCLGHSEKDGIWVLPNFEKDSVTVYLPQELLISLLYEPGRYNLKRIAESWQIELVIPWHMEGDDLIGAMRKAIPASAESTQVAYSIWASSCPDRVMNWGLFPVSIPKEKARGQSVIDRLFHRNTAS